MSYKLKEWETWDSKATYHPPKYCPNCQEPLNGIIQYWADSSRKETLEHPLRGIGYDCYCYKCKWGGTIEPDSDSDIIKEPYREKANKK